MKDNQVRQFDRGRLISLFGSSIVIKKISENQKKTINTEAVAELRNTLTCQSRSRIYNDK